eukprot:5555132-Pyramimonas_sp.AAC.1
MAEDMVPPAAIVAIRRRKEDRDCGKQLWPARGPRWECPPLECQRAPVSKYEICAPPRPLSRQEQVAQ